MIAIKEFVNLCNDNSDSEDLLRIVNVCVKHGIEITTDEADELWNYHSDDYCANWLILPDDDERLYEVVIETARKMWGDKDENN